MVTGQSTYFTAVHSTIASGTRRELTFPPPPSPVGGGKGTLNGSGGYLQGLEGAVEKC